MDRTVVKAYKLGNEPKDYEYWLTQPPEKRLSAIELLRKQMNPQNGPESRLQRVYRVVKLEES